MGCLSLCCVLSSQFDDFTVYTAEEKGGPSPRITRVQEAIKATLSEPPQAFLKILKKLGRVALITMVLTKESVDFSLVLVRSSGPDKAYPNPYATDPRFPFPLLSASLEVCDDRDSAPLSLRITTQLALWMKCLIDGQKAMVNEEFARVEMEKKEEEYVQEISTPLSCSVTTQVRPVERSPTPHPAGKRRIQPVMPMY
jgi:hypothetical protein